MLMISVHQYIPIIPNISQYIPETSPKNISEKISQGSDFLGILHLLGLILPKTAAFRNEALVLMDDPFAGFSNEEVDELFEAGAPDVV